MRHSLAADRMEFYGGSKPSDNSLVYPPPPYQESSFPHQISGFPETSPTGSLQFQNGPVKKFCGKCGSPVVDYSNTFCTECGSVLNLNSPPPTHQFLSTPTSQSSSPNPVIPASSAATLRSIFDASPTTTGLPPIGSIPLFKAAPPKLDSQRKVARAWVVGILVFSSILLIVGGCLIGLTKKSPDITPWYSPTFCHTSEDTWVVYPATSECPIVLMSNQTAEQILFINKHLDKDTSYYFEYARSITANGYVYVSLYSSTGSSISSYVDSSISSPLGGSIKRGEEIEIIRNGPSFGLFPPECLEGCDFKVPDPLYKIPKSSYSFSTTFIESGSYPLNLRIGYGSTITDSESNSERPPVFLVRMIGQAGLSGAQIGGIVMVCLGGLAFLITLGVGFQYLKC